MDALCSNASFESIRPLIVRKKCSDEVWAKFSASCLAYLGWSIGQPALAARDIQSLREDTTPKTNLTPNGGVSPKKENAIVYNLFLSAWCDVIREAIKGVEETSAGFRLTPNLRLKFGVEDTRNVSRGLNTGIAHSDAWVEGPWGLNCHIPIAGDVLNNFLQFYKLKDPTEFSDDFVQLSPTYTEMDWVLDFYEIDTDFVAEPGYVYLSDYALIHRTYRGPSAGSRLSLDSTLWLMEGFDVAEDRRSEYLQEIPEIGSNLWIKCVRSETEDILDKSSVYSHYSSNLIERVWF